MRAHVPAVRLNTEDIGGGSRTRRQRAWPHGQERPRPSAPRKGSIDGHLGPHVVDPGHLGRRGGPVHCGPCGAGARARSREGGRGDPAGGDGGSLARPGSAACARRPRSSAPGEADEPASGAPAGGASVTSGTAPRSGDEIHAAQSAWPVQPSSTKLLVAFEYGRLSGWGGDIPLPVEPGVCRHQS
jgi:hypothetical protein